MDCEHEEGGGGGDLRTHETIQNLNPIIQSYPPLLPAAIEGNLRQSRVIAGKPGLGTHPDQPDHFTGRRRVSRVVHRRDGPSTPVARRGLQCAMAMTAMRSKSMDTAWVIRICVHLPSSAGPTDL